MWKDCFLSPLQGLGHHQPPPSQVTRGLYRLSWVPLWELCLPKGAAWPKVTTPLPEHSTPHLLDWLCDTRKVCPPCFSSVQRWVAILASELCVESDWGINQNCITTVPLPPLISPVVLTLNTLQEIPALKSLSQNAFQIISLQTSLSMADSVHL